MKMALKKQFSRVCYGMGFFRILSSRHQCDAFILAYHRILPTLDNENVFVQPGMYVSSASFRLQMSFLKEKFNIVSLSELLDRVSGGEDISGCCSITFDDGWLDNYQYAFPLLQQQNIPATVFLATGFIGTDQLFWPEELVSYLCQYPIEELISMVPMLKELVCDLETPYAGPVFLDAAISGLKTWSVEKRTTLLNSLQRHERSSFPGRLLMNWDEIRAMKASGLISIGSHTKNHVLLDQLSPHEAENEIVQSRDEIHSQLGFWPDLFAYPNGNFTPELQKILTSQGFRGGVTTRQGWFRELDNRYEIPRFCMHEDVSNSIPLFLARLHLRGF